MKEIMKIVNLLEYTGSTNGKIEIIKSNKDNELFKKVLKYTYQDDLQYKFSDKKLRKLIEDNKFERSINIWIDGFAMLDKLAQSNINNSLRDSVLTFLSLQTEEVKELWIRILTKDLRCKISAKTINKAIPMLIEDWNVQGGMSFKKVKLKKDEWIALTLKMNGVRGTKYEAAFKSRQNKPMLGLDHILADIKALGLDERIVADGELVRKNIDNVPDNENFRMTCSILNSESADKSEIELVIFDVLPKDEFDAGESKQTYKKRLELLEALRGQIERLGLTNIRIAPVYYTGTDHSKIKEWLEYVDKLGLEGLMCMRDVVYKCKKHTGVLKCKVFETGDFKVIAFTEGEKGMAGSLGSFIIEFKENSVGVGSGFKEHERKAFWIDRDSYIGKIIEVQYKEETMDKDTGLPSLQFPTFLRVRDDKTKPSY